MMSLSEVHIKYIDTRESSSTHQHQHKAAAAGHLTNSLLQHSQYLHIIYNVWKIPASLEIINLTKPIRTGVSAAEQHLPPDGWRAAGWNLSHSCWLQLSPKPNQRTHLMNGGNQSPKPNEWHKTCHMFCFPCACFIGGFIYSEQRTGACLLRRSSVFFGSDNLCKCECRPFEGRQSPPHSSLGIGWFRWSVSAHMTLAYNSKSYFELCGCFVLSNLLIKAFVWKLSSVIILVLKFHPLQIMLS